MSPAASSRLCPRRASRALGASSLVREAASSMASGSPSSRLQIAATSAAFPSHSAKPGLTEAACWTNSCVALQAATAVTPPSPGT
jgi:hypothetical protein